MAQISLWILNHVGHKLAVVRCRLIASPSWALTFTPKDGRGSTLEALTARWRTLTKPVIGRVADGRLWLDLRCLEDEAALLRNWHHDYCHRRPCRSWQNHTLQAITGVNADRLPEEKQRG